MYAQHLQYAKSLLPLLDTENHTFFAAELAEIEAQGPAHHILEVAECVEYHAVGHKCGYDVAYNMGKSA